MSQPARTSHSPLVDTHRKEQLILQKQVRQCTTTTRTPIHKHKQSNLPTLIEASPDFHKKSLPFLPNLPASVQIGDERSDIQTWFDQYTDTDVMSVTTDDVPSLCSLPQRFRMDETQWDSRRRERSASITFDLDEGRRSRLDEEDRRAEIKRRNSKKERKGGERQPGGEHGSDRELGRRAGEHGGDVARDRDGTDMKQEMRGRRNWQQEETHGSNTGHCEETGLSMWSCRRCTLENALQEATCLACGGSRLSSIGDIEPVTYLVKEPFTLLRGEEQEKGAQEEWEPKEGEQDRRWRCVVCTLENEPLAYYCDACNTQSPLKTIKDLQDLQRKEEGWKAMDLGRKAARYFAIFCFLAILTISLYNMAISIYSVIVSMRAMLPMYSSPSPTIHTEDNPLSTKPDHLTSQSLPPSLVHMAATKSIGRDSMASVLPVPTSHTVIPPTSNYEDLVNLECMFTVSFLGLQPFLLIIFSPLFLLLLDRVSHYRQTVLVIPRVAMPAS